MQIGSIYLSYLHQSIIYSSRQCGREQSSTVAIATVDDCSRFTVHTTIPRYLTVVYSLHIKVI